MYYEIFIYYIIVRDASENLGAVVDSWDNCYKTLTSGEIKEINTFSAFTKYHTR